MSCAWRAATRCRQRFVRSGRSPKRARVRFIRHSRRRCVRSTLPARAQQPARRCAAAGGGASGRCADRPVARVADRAAWRAAAVAAGGMRRGHGRAQTGKRQQNREPPTTAVRRGSEAGGGELDVVPGRGRLAVIGAAPYVMRRRSRRRRRAHFRTLRETVTCQAVAPRATIRLRRRATQPPCARPCRAMQLLAFDTATPATTVALPLADGKLAHASPRTRSRRAARATRASCCRSRSRCSTRPGSAGAQLDRIAVGVGPGHVHRPAHRRRDGPRARAGARPAARRRLDAARARRAAPRRRERPPSSPCSTRAAARRSPPPGRRRAPSCSRPPRSTPEALAGGRRALAPRPGWRSGTGR